MSIEFVTMERKTSRLDNVEREQVKKIINEYLTRTITEQEAIQKIENVIEEVIEDII